MLGLPKLFKRKEPEFQVSEADKSLQGLLHDFVMDHNCGTLSGGMRFYTTIIQEGSVVWRALDLHAQKERVN